MSGEGILTGVVQNQFVYIMMSTQRVPIEWHAYFRVNRPLFPYYLFSVYCRYQRELHQ